MSSWRLALILTPIWAAFAIPVAVQARSVSCESLFLNVETSVASSVAFSGAVIDIDQQIKNLAQLRIRIDLAKAMENTGPEELAARSAYDKKETQLISYVSQKNIMTRVEVIARLKQEIETYQSNGGPIDNEDSDKKEREQDQAILESVINGERILFHEIEPGSFMFGHREQKLLTLDKPFQMARLVTTQLVWRKVVEAAHLKFPDQYNDLKPVPTGAYFPLGPVAKISHSQVGKWFDALNRLANVGDPLVSELMPGHKKGDTYRLPTDQEWDFVARDRGATPRVYFLKDNIEEHAWVGSNSGRAVHAVATRKPLRLSGGDFYDMFGNVFQMTTLAPFDREFFNARGGDCTSENQGSAFSRTEHDMPLPFRVHGFRIVRVSQ